ncbi:acylphosphatase-1 [Drosophila grimshawi]|uniref:acylphosphatase n=1 Tax=Drosophila grimshawi TaxID=7222 RepID=B4JY70_DROGR|nr:acylphosphatase-1 [Drosophila grimshawi]EDV90632.1 GH14072 [Drosophila grimshawi]
MASSKSKPDLVSCDFEIHGAVPKEAFELFAATQAQLLGLRGYVVRIADDFYKGQLQGEGKVIEAFKQLIVTAGEYVAAIKEFVIKNLKSIQEYSYEAFEIRK